MIFRCDDISTITYWYTGSASWLVVYYDEDLNTIKTVTVPVSSAWRNYSISNDYKYFGFGSLTDATESYIYVTTRS